MSDTERIAYIHHSASPQGPFSTDSTDRFRQAPTAKGGLQIYWHGWRTLKPHDTLTGYWTFRGLNSLSRVQLR